MHNLVKNQFGLKIRRTTDLIAEQGREAFWRTGIALDSKLTSLVLALYEQNGQSSSELAKKTGLLRQLVESRLKALEKDGYIRSEISAADARKRVFFLTAKKQEEIQTIVDTMACFEAVYQELWDEIGVDLAQSMLKLEQALYSRPLLSRLCNLYPQFAEKIEV